MLGVWKDKERFDELMAMYSELYDDLDNILDKIKEIRTGFEAMEFLDYVDDLKKAEEKVSKARWDVC